MTAWGDACLISRYAVESLTHTRLRDKLAEFVHQEQDQEGADPAKGAKSRAKRKDKEKDKESAMMGGLEGRMLEPRGYTRAVWEAADPLQPLLRARRVHDSNHVFRRLVRTAHGEEIGEEKEEKLADTEEGGKDDDDDEEKSGEDGWGPLGREALLAPECCTLAPRWLSRRLLLGAQAVLPALWLLEARLKAWALLRRVRAEAGRAKDALAAVRVESVLRALSKPDYERLECLGDSYLKVAMTQCVVFADPPLDREGLLSEYRANLVGERVLVRWVSTRH
jgi:hypothetical protein